MVNNTSSAEGFNTMSMSKSAIFFVNITSFNSQARYHVLAKRYSVPSKCYWLQKESLNPCLAKVTHGHGKFYYKLTTPRWLGPMIWIW